MQRQSGLGFVLAAACLFGLDAGQASAQVRFPGRHGGQPSHPGPVRFPGRHGGMAGQPQFARPSVPYGGGFPAPTFERGSGLPSPQAGRLPSGGGFFGGFAPFYGSAPYSAYSEYGDPYFPYRDQSQGWARGQGQRSWAVVTLRIRPRQAAIYLNGDLIGTAGDFARREALLHLPTGTYQLGAAAPGYRPLSLRLRLRPGQTVVVDRSLRRDPDTSSRRSGSERSD